MNIDIENIPTNNNQEQEAAFAIYKEFEQILGTYLTLQFESTASVQSSAFMSSFLLGLIKEMAIHLPGVAQYAKYNTFHMEMEILRLKNKTSQ